MKSLDAHRAAALAFALGLAASVLAAETKPAPPAPPPDSVRRNLCEQATRTGWLKGVRQIELIRADILSVTLDSGITTAIAPTQYIVDSDVPRHRASLEVYARADMFTITSPTDPDYRVPQRPVGIGQCTYEGRNSAHREATLPACTTFYTDCFLFLPKPMKSGHDYTVNVAPHGEKDDRLAYAGTLAYDDAKTTTKVIKINQVAYSLVARQRFAYLGWWAGSAGKVDYAALKRFEVLDEQTRKIVAQGEIRFRADESRTCGEDIYEMDLAPLAAGRYHIRIPGLGCSEVFAIGGAGIQGLYYHTLRAFFHQRCGQEFRPPWTWVKKPACHSEVLASGCMPIGSPLIIPEPSGGSLPKTTEPAPGEKPRHFQGGYHDAGDYDVFTYPLPAMSELITVYEIFPEAFADGDLDLPESRNNIPDILDEAGWGLSAFLDLQYTNGAVPLGRGNLQDGISQNFENGYDQWHQNGVIPSYGILPPRADSTPTFAAVAAQFARVCRKFDEALAARYLAAAEKAFAYGSTHDPQQVWTAYNASQYPLKKDDTNPESWLRCCCWAAAELLRATGKPEFEDYLHAHPEQLSLMAWNYSTPRVWALANAEAAAPALRAECRRELLADSRAEVTARNPYRMSFPYWDKNSGWWGTMQGIDAADRLVRAYALSGKQKYLDALSLNADWHLGCNPRSETWITNLGYRYPRRPEISHFLYEQSVADLGGRTVSGISVYGLGPALRDWFGDWPMHRSRRDVWDDGAEVYNEFTVQQTLAPAAATYATLYALEKRAGSIPAGAKPDPMRIAGSAAKQ